MQPRQVGFALGALLFVAGTGSLEASINLHLSLAVDASATDHARISGLVSNTGEVAAFDVYAELWPDGNRQRLGDLHPGEERQVSWTIPTTRWIDTLCQVAAMRVRYRDALEHWADAVVAAGQTDGAEVAAPVWPEPATFSLKWTRAPAASGRVVWWRPFALGVLAPEKWEGASGSLTIDGRLSPSSAIGGWTSAVYALVLPDASGGVAVPGSILRVDVDARERGRLWRIAWRWPAVWLAMCGAVWVLASRRRTDLPALTTTAALGAVALALFPPGLLALDTTPAGGDYASHIVGLSYLRETLLPSGRAFGWFPGQFGGFPLFLFYFPLPFLAAAVLSAAMPLTVAMKAASLFGTALLPFAWWLTLGWLGAPRAARWLGAAASAWLLVGEWQTVWGANLASTLAGEFAYSLGYALAWLAMAYAWRTRDDRNAWRPLAALFALTAMSHGYALVAAACGVLLLVLHPVRGPARAWRLGWVALVAFGLAAWWLVPFLWNMPWTVGVRGRWVLTAGEYLPRPLWLAGAIAGAGIVRRVARAETQEAGGVAWLAAFSLAMIGMYVVGFSLGVVDVRFLPFFHGGLILLACWEAGVWIEAMGPSLAPFAVSLVVAATVGSAAMHVTYLPDWIRWNFNGMERTGPWPYFHDVMQQIAGRLSDPRVAFEHHPDHDGVGTTRAFEMTPWFAGRSSLEGLYRESALLAEPVYYIQSELTRTPSCPIEGLECGRFNPERSLPHLGLFAVDTIVTYGDAAARALENYDGVSTRGRIGPYEIFSIDRPRPLVEPALFRPVVDESGDWRGDSYDWFRAAADLDVPLVLRRAARDGEPRVARYIPRELPRERLDTLSEVVSRQDGGLIEIDGARPGHPLLIKTAYHPGWRADDGSTVDLVAPGMMLVTPRASRVVLRWTAGSAGTAGLIMTLAALVAFAAVRRMPAGLPAVSPAAGFIWCAFVVILAGGLVAAAMIRHPAADYGQLLAEGQRATAAKNFALADGLFERVLAESDRHHALRDDAGVYFALAAEAAGRSDETEARLRRFLSEFPVSTFRGEVLVRLARLLRADGRAGDAARLLDEAIVAPLAEPAWVEAARLELAELGGQ